MTNIYYTLEDPEYTLDTMCACGHPVSSHSYITGGQNLLDFHIISVSQCVHPDCNFTEEIPRTDRRRRKTYQWKHLCDKFRKA